MKIVINRCYGGFSLSAKAVKRLAELSGRECYFFVTDRENFDAYSPVPIEGCDKSLFFTAFDIPNPNEVLGVKGWRERTKEESVKHNEEYSKHYLTCRPDDRTDPKLIQVVEELGAGHREGASGACAELEIVEIPDGVQWEIDEYDGIEHIAEQHRTWR